MWRRARIVGGIALFFLIVTLLFSATIFITTFSPTSISFPDRDPDTYSEVTSLSDLSLSFWVGLLSSSQYWVIELYAVNDLTSGSNTIPIQNVRWTISGSATVPGSFYNGTLSRGVYVEAGRGPGSGSGSWVYVSCTLRFYLQNSWSYATGNYSATVTVRITAPGTAATRNLTLTINIASRASLQLGMNTINFPAANPDSYPSIAANENPVSVTSKVRTGASNTATLTCLAPNDLIYGSSLIQIGNVSWQASGTGYVSGTMSKTTAQTAGSWTGSGTRSGTFSYYLVNSWAYATGLYTVVVVYTLTAP